MQKFYKGEFDSQDKLNQNFGDLYQNVKTYSELQAMVTNNLLVAGTQYVLSDYKTKYQQPDTLVIKEMGVERLVLTATSENTFDVVCSSLDFPQDIIHYRFDLNVCEDDTTPRTGFITRRIDESPNVTIDCPLDWRTILWARWKPDPNNYLLGTVTTPYSVWTSGAAVLDVIYKSGNTLYMAINTNVPLSATDGAVFQKVYDDINVGMLLNANLSIGTTGTVEIYLIKGALHERPTFGSNCNRISISQTFYGKVSGTYYLTNNVFGANCAANTCGTNFYKNTFGDGCSTNTFGSTCAGNIFFGGSCSNVFGSNCNDNVFAGVCCHNTFLNNCYTNRFWGITGGNTFDSDCIGNKFGGSCNGNSFQVGCTNNVFKKGSGWNTFGPNCSNNYFNTGCCYNTFATNCYNNTFAKDCSSNIFSSSCWGIVFGVACLYNTLGCASYQNVFGTNCCSNHLNCYSIGNTFGDNKVNLFVKCMRNRNISAVTALENRDYTNTIERRNDLVIVYWTLNSSNVPVYTVIA